MTGFVHDETTEKSYCTGVVTSAGFVGGFCAENYGTVTGCFWDTTTSGENTSAGGTGKNTTEMQDIDTYTAASWDIVLKESHEYEIWLIDDGTDYPELREYSSEYEYQFYIYHNGGWNKINGVE